MDEPDRDVSTVANVLAKRTSLLTALADGPTDQRRLRDELGVSRSTVYKALKELEEVGLVEQRAGGYGLTGFGRLAWQRHDAYLARLERLNDAERLLEGLPADRQYPPSLFEHGHIVTTGRNAPERPLERMEARAANTVQLRCLSPVGMPRYLEATHERVEETDQTVTLVTESAALSRLADSYDRFEAALEEPGLNLKASTEQLPFAVMLFDDDEIGLFAYDDGSLLGAAFSSDDDAIRWGRTVFERARERSELVERSTPV
jgi:predicted transcriptional regulator